MGNKNRPEEQSKRYETIFSKLERKSKKDILPKNKAVDIKKGREKEKIDLCERKLNLFNLNKFMQILTSEMYQ